MKQKKSNNDKYELLRSLLLNKAGYNPLKIEELGSVNHWKECPEGVSFPKKLEQYINHNKPKDGSSTKLFLEGFLGFRTKCEGKSYAIKPKTHSNIGLILDLTYEKNKIHKIEVSPLERPGFGPEIFLDAA